MKDPNEEQHIQRVWYAVQTFHRKEERLGEYFAKKGLSFFIPKRYQEVVSPDGRKCRKLVPAVHNLLFLEKTFDDAMIRELILKSPVPFFIMCRRETRKPCEIRDAEMMAFRTICDPDYGDTLYIDAFDAAARLGSRVRVKQGLFKGLEGKLTRYKNRFYVVVTIASLGVMVHVPKWFCEKLD